ncbi:TetR/AcrR family transcriptional regulator [Nocardia sp. BMG111209]|uniref:TetR/AcrR family transcriptional regulator n=1 Tax=Nocardia sp. BMG111209 TaxID=1160137 RepID=UPI000361DF5A|nr:TetR/AcrR family transcriptional regulator [Nocardia sp. BMG111209]
MENPSAAEVDRKAGNGETRRGPYAKTAARIEAILDAALDLFTTDGFRGATMRELAIRAGMSQTGLMHHFPTKDDVLIALLQRGDHRYRTRSPETDDLPPLDRLVAVVDDVVRDPALTALRRVLAAEAVAPDHPAHAYFRDRTTFFVGRAVTVFTELQDQGRLRPGATPAALGRCLVALLDGLQLQWLYDPTIDIATELRTALLDAWVIR